MFILIDVFLHLSKSHEVPWFQMCPCKQGYYGNSSACKACKRLNHYIILIWLFTVIILLCAFKHTHWLSKIWVLMFIVNSAKIETSSHCQLHLFSANLATSCIKYCSGVLNGLHQICQFLLWDVTPLFHQGTCKFLDISWGNGPSPHTLIQQVPDMLNGLEIRALR